jgi:molybdopterin molybdotransferase
MSAPASTPLGPSPLARGDELPVAQAQALIAAALTPVEGVETVALAEAAGRVLAADLVSPIDVPAHDNSAMDGYAFAAADLHPEQVTRLRAVAGTVFAGVAFGGRLASGECIRIMTGAVMPAGLDTVVPIELLRHDGDTIEFAAGAVKAGDNRRHRGEDLARGQVALAAGRQLRPADVGLAASLGLATLGVRRRLRVALFSTGDEVVEPGQPLPPACIYDSNRFGLGAALRRLGAEVIDLGLVPDDRAALAAAVDRAMAQADVVVTSGGVSMGDADYTRELLAERGEVAFWKVAMRPGRPFAFGPLHGADGRRVMLFALPGNPVAALVTFYVFVRDGLLQLMGAAPRPLPALRARSAAAIRKRPGRSEYQRAIVERAADGEWEVRLTGAQGAGVLRSLSMANALVVLGPAQGSVAAGDGVEVWLFDGLV